MKNEELSEELQESMHERTIAYKRDRMITMAGFFGVLAIFAMGFGSCSFNSVQGTKSEIVKVEAERLETERARYVTEKAMWEHTTTEKKEEKK